MFNNDKLDELCWALFEKSGNISYYLLGKKLKDNSKEKEKE